MVELSGSGTSGSRVGAIVVIVMVSGHKEVNWMPKSEADFLQISNVAVVFAQTL